MASIEKRSENTYRITVSCGYDTSGKKLRKHKTVTLPDNLTERQREKEIQKQAVLFEKEVENGTYLDGEKITFAEFAEIWLRDYAEKQLEPSTLVSYKMRLNNRIIPAMGHLKISKIQPHHLLEFYNNLSENGIRMDAYYKATVELVSLLNETKIVHIADEIGISPKTYIRIKKGERTKIDIAQKICKYFKMDFTKSFTIDNKQERLSDKMIKTHHDLISSILSTAVKWNLITSNPAERVKPPKVNKKQSEYYDDGQIIQLFSLLKNEPLKYKLAIYLTIDTGLRLSEVAGLEWNDIELDNNRLIITRQRQYVTGYGTIKNDPKTESGVRFITVSDVIINMLKKYSALQKEDRLKAGSLWIDSDNVFIHEYGKPMHPHRPYKWFMEFLEKNHLPKITFHALRHTNASLLIAEGIDIVTLSGRLGHSDKNVTLNTYSHIIKSKEKQAANIMDRFYTEAME